MSHKICENCRIHAWKHSENILVSISIIIMKKIDEKISFPVFMSKIINSFSIRYGSGKINEPRHGNPIQVTVSRATLWKINWATIYGKLLVILIMKKGNNIFLAIFLCNYWSTYNASTFALILGVYLVLWRGNWCAMTCSPENIDPTIFTNLVSQTC